MELSAAKLELLRRSLHKAKMAAEQISEGGRLTAEQRAAHAVMITALEQAADVVRTSPASKSHANESAGPAEDVFEEDESSNLDRIVTEAEGIDVIVPVITHEERDAVDDALQEPEDVEQPDDETLNA